MSLVGFFSRDDARVAGFECSWVWVQVFVSAHELSLVVGAAIANHDLGRVLIGHDHGRLGQSASECVGVVWLQRLFQHAGVQVISHLELVLR